MPIPAPETPPAHTIQDLELRCRILEIEQRCAQLKAEEYRKLLEEKCIQAGHAATEECVF
jgi:hypothetical protein